MKILSQKRIWRQSLNSYGFTTLEIVVSLSLFVVIIILTSMMYSLSQRSYNQGYNEGELSQNIRVILDRMSREIRQSTDIVTLMPATNNDPLDPPVEEIFFQDGHDVSQIIYIKYRVEDTDLMRSRLAYFFDPNPDVYVEWDSVDLLNDLREIVFEDRVVGEYVDYLELWGSEGLIHILIELEKNNSDLNIETSVYSRNY